MMHDEARAHSYLLMLLTAKGKQNYVATMEIKNRKTLFN